MNINFVSLLYIFIKFKKMDNDENNEFMKLSPPLSPNKD